jgi:organic radical activating enzyme
MTTLCNLNCKDCCHLTNIYSKRREAAHISTEELIGNLTNYLDSVDRVNRVSLVGGEPLLHKDITKIIGFLRTTGKIRKIVLITNGTIMPSEETIKCIKENNVVVFISNYGDLSPKASQFSEKLGQYNIPYFVTPEQLMWNDFGGFESRKRSEKELNDIYKKCDLDCVHILEGKVHMCVRSSHAMHLNLIPENEADFVDFTKPDLNYNEAKKKLRKLLKYKNAISACNHCDPRGMGRPVLSAIQEKR